MVDFKSEIKLMTLVYIEKLNFIIRKTNVNTQKIDCSTLITYGIAITGFLLQNKLEKVEFFKNIFLLVNTNIKIIFGMLFLTFSNINI